MLRAAAISSLLDRRGMQLRQFLFHSSNRLASAEAANLSYVEVTGLSSAQLRAVRSAALTDEQWASAVSRGRQRYGAGDARHVRRHRQRAAVHTSVRARRRPPVHRPIRSVASAGSRTPALRLRVVATVTVPATHVVPSTTVARVYPSGDTVPENLLRMYVEFSGPMGRPSGIPHMKLLGSDGREIEGAFLPLDYEFWDPAHTRFTAFLDPGRVKSGILPNKQMGRALDAGRTVTLVISREWRDEHGLPLKDEYRRVLQVAAPVQKPLDPRHGASSRRPRAAGMRSS